MASPIVCRSSCLTSEIVAGTFGFSIGSCIFKNQPDGQVEGIRNIVSEMSQLGQHAMTNGTVIKQYDAV